MDRRQFMVLLSVLLTAGRTIQGIHPTTDVSMRDPSRAEKLDLAGVQVEVISPAGTADDYSFEAEVV